MGVRANQSKYVRHSEKVSEVEIDMLLKEYFAEHQMMTRRDFQEVCGFKCTTKNAFGTLAWEKESWWNIGLRNQPMYACPGYYSIRDAAHPFTVVTVKDVKEVFSLNESRKRLMETYLNVKGMNKGAQKKSESFRSTIKESP